MAGFCENSAFRAGALALCATFSVATTLEAQGIISSSQSRDPAVLTEAGMGALGARSYQRARENFRSALDADPTFVRAQRGLARAEMGLGRFDDAWAQISPLRAVSPSYMLDAAALLLVSGNPDKALAEIDAARDLAQSMASKRDGGRVRPDFLKKLHMLRGDTLYRLGGYDAALNEFEAANAIIEGADAWRAIGDVHLAIGSAQNAFTAYSEALRIRRFDGSAYQRRARVRFLLGDVEGALADYSEAEVDLVETPALLAEMAETYIAAEAYGDAIGVLNRLLSFVKDEPERAKIVRWNLASALIEAGRPHEAEKQLRQIGEWPGMEVQMLFLQARTEFGRGNFNATRQLLSEALRLRRNDPSLLYNRGVAALRAGHVERALDDFGEGLKRSPQSTAIRDAIGKVKLYQGNVDEGLLIYNAGVERNPADPEPRLRRARALLAINQAEAALADAQQASLLDPDSTAAAAIAARALLDLDRPEDCLRHADKLIASRSGKREGFVLRARAYIALGRANDGLSALEQARNFGAPEGELALLEGSAHSVNGAYEDAVVAYDRALAIIPASIVAHEQRGDALAALGQLTLASRDYDAALEKLPTSVALRMKRAEALRRDTRCAEAISDYDLVLGQDPNDHAALRGRGKCKMSDGAFVAGLKDMVSSFF